MELVKAALAEALRLLRLQAPPTSLQDPGTPGPTRDRYACCQTFLLPLAGASPRGIGLMHWLPSSPAAPPGLPPARSPSSVSRGTQTETEVETESSPGPPGLINGPAALHGGGEEPGGTQSEGGGSSSSGTGSPGPPGLLRLVQPPQRTDT